MTSENRSGVDIEKRDELVRYYYDKANRLTKTNVEGKVTEYAYDLAGNLLSDGESSYTYDLQNRLLTKTNADGTTTYEYDAAGNLVKETSPDGSVSYTYNAQNKLIRGELSDGQSSSYTYNALGVRIENEQIRTNKNAGNQNAALTDGSHGVDYLDFLRDGRADWQRAWESEVGTTHQNDFETVTRHYIVDYLSEANRDIMVTEDGSYTTRYVYDENGKRISAEFGYAENTQRGAAGENLQSDFASELHKVWYRTSLLNSTLFAVDANGDVVAHMIYDAWANPLVETYTDTNFSGLENLNNFTGYTWDETLGLYFAQNRFYDAENHRFTQEDVVKDGGNWYVYCGNNPCVNVDVWGFASTNPYDSINWDSLTPYSKNSNYYSARDVFVALNGGKALNPDPYDKKTNSATFSYTYAGKTVKLYYDLDTVEREKAWIFFSKGKEGTSFTGTFSGGEKAMNISLIYSGKKAYIHKGSVQYYFQKVWCETKDNKPVTVKPAAATTVSDQLVEFVKAYEGFSETPYYATSDERDSGIQTIGYGHVIQPGESLSFLTEAEATQLLKQDIIDRFIPYELINRMAAKGLYLTQCQLDALTSLCYNVGENTLTESFSPHFNEILLSATSPGEYDKKTIEDQFQQYTKQNGEVVPGLVTRRKAEANMFNYGIYDSSH